MDATCKIQDGIHMPRIIKKCVQDSGYISFPDSRTFSLFFSFLQRKVSSQHQQFQFLQCQSYRPVPLSHSEKGTDILIFCCENTDCLSILKEYLFQIFLFICREFFEFCCFLALITKRFCFLNSYLLLCFFDCANRA